MSDETQPDNPPASPAHTQPVSPDTLMSDFRGKPIVAIVIFTLIAHGLFIGVFSLGYLRDQVLGEDTSSLSEDERMDIALDEGTKALREIAERHNLSVQDLSNRFADGKPRASKPAPADEGNASDPADDPDTAEGTGSEIEKDLDRTETGPPEPDLSDGIDEEDDLFGPGTP